MSHHTVGSEVCLSQCTGHTWQPVKSSGCYYSNDIQIVCSEKIYESATTLSQTPTQPSMQYQDKRETILSENFFTSDETHFQLILPQDESPSPSLDVNVSFVPSNENVPGTYYNTQLGNSLSKILIISLA